MTAAVAQTTAASATTCISSSSSSSSSSSARRARRDGAPQQPPSGSADTDGGWGWAVVVAGFMAQFLAYGSPQSVGVLYPGWLHLFQEGKGMTAWVGSLVSGVGLIVGPVCSVCVVYFGARPVTVFSGVMVGGGLMLSAFAPNISFLIFSYGIVVGIGCGLVYSATLTITCLYFDKRRGLALGIVTTGGSVGGFVYATAKAELIDLFGLDGCLLLVGALALNIIACAGPMRPLTPPKYYLKQRAAILERAAAKGRRQQQQQLYQKVHAPVAFEEPIITRASPEELSPHEKPLLANNRDLAIVIEAKELAVMETTTRRRSGGVFSCSALVKIIKSRLRDYSTCCSSTMALFQDRVFMSLCISLFLFSLGAFPPLLFMEDVAQSGGLSDGVAAVPLVSLTAISAGAGKMALGMLADLPLVNSVHLYALTLAGSGLGLLLIPVTKTYLGLQMLCTALGFLSGNWSLTSYVTTQLVGMERLTEAHGILMFFGGFGIMLGPPVVGWFYDMTQSYDLAFYLSGACVLLGGAILFVSALPCRGCRTAANKPESSPPSSSAAARPPRPEEEEEEAVSQTEFVECTVAVGAVPAEPAAVLYTTTTLHMVASVA